MLLRRNRAGIAVRTRRAFLLDGALVLAGGAAGTAFLAQAAKRNLSTQNPAVRVGLIADVHYADKKSAGTRHYRDSIDKMRRAVATLNDSGVDIAIELGDLIDAGGGTVEAEVAYLKRIEAEFAKLKKVDRHYVLGNHCVHTLTKGEFIENCAATLPHYSFDTSGFHFRHRFDHLRKLCLQYLTNPLV